jgi:hypothetical protein
MEAQFIKEREMSAQIGYGMSAPYNSIDNIVDSGFFLQGEYVLIVASWFELKPYVGLILTNSDGKDIYNQPSDEKATSKALLLGGKARVRAPIPWVAPYVEIGMGASIGKFETSTAFDSLNKNGLLYHFPFSFGLELGRHNKVDIGLAYFFQPTVRQYVGAFAVGISIPLNN